MNHNTHGIPLPFVTFQYTFELQVIFTRMKTTTLSLFNALVSIMYAARAFNVNFLIIHLSWWDGYCNFRDSILQNLNFQPGINILNKRSSKVSWYFF